MALHCKFVENFICLKINSLRLPFVSGGGGHHGNTTAQRSADIKVPGMAGVVPEVPLIDLATRGKSSY